MVRFAEYLGEIRSVAPRLTETLLVYEYLPSTNLEARRLLERLPSDCYPLPPFAVLAREQRAGRGRQGRLWRSPPGGLYVSWVVALGEEGPPRTLPLVAGVALCRGLRAAGAHGCGLKWPNDLMVEGRKIGGILIEVVAPRPGARPSAIIGCGVNVDVAPQELQGLEATTLVRETGSRVALGELFADLTLRLGDGLGRLDQPEAVAEEYGELLVHRPGDRLSWTRGGERLDGTFVGIDALGGLRLETEGEERVLSAGEVIET